MSSVIDSGRRRFPFNAEQVVNILGEMGPLFLMFIANGIWGITVGTWTLIGSTVASLIVSLIVLGRPPIMPFIAGAVTITFGYLTIATGDPMWVQIKVTLFNALVAALLWIGMVTDRNFFKFVFGKTFNYTPEGWRQLTRNLALFFLLTAVANEFVRIGAVNWHIPTFWRVITGVDIWIAFKLVVVMPVTGLFLVWQVKRMQKHRLPDRQG